MICLFPSKGFTISGLTFSPLIHFESIFVYDIRKCSNFILLHAAVQFSQFHLLKRLSFLRCVFLPLLSKIRYLQVHGFISGLAIMFHWSLSVSALVPYCLGGFPGSSAGKETACNTGDPASIPGSGRSPGEGIGYWWSTLGFPGGSDSKESVCNVGDLGSIPGSGRSPGGGHGNPLQYSCLENPHGQRSLAG